MVILALRVCTCICHDGKESQTETTALVKYRHQRKRRIAIPIEPRFCHFMFITSILSTHETLTFCLSIFLAKSFDLRLFATETDHEDTIDNWLGCNNLTLRKIAIRMSKKMPKTWHFFQKNCKKNCFSKDCHWQFIWKKN